MVFIELKTNNYCSRISKWGSYYCKARIAGSHRTAAASVVVERHSLPAFAVGAVDDPGCQGSRPFAAMYSSSLVLKRQWIRQLSVEGEIPWRAGTLGAPSRGASCRRFWGSSLDSCGL